MSGRLPGLDVARGLATLLMIQTHAYDAWVRPDARASVAFRITRVLGTLPLPLFLMLAGMSCAVRLERACSKNEPASTVRRALLRNALEVVGWGYALNVAYALLDGARGLDTLLRVDVLHAIGLSLLVLALFVRGDAVPDLVRFRRLALWMALLPLLLSPVLTPLGTALSGALRYVAAPFIELRGLSPMPLVPLASFTAVGALLGLGHREPVRKKPLAAWATLGIVATLVGSLGTAWASRAGLVISRAEPTIVLNAVDLVGRASLALALVFALTPHAARALAGPSLVGRSSLFVYGLHIPFCYGRFGRPVKRALDMGQASLGVALLIAACVLAVLLRTRMRRGQKPPPALSLSS